MLKQTQNSFLVNNIILLQQIIWVFIHLAGRLIFKCQRAVFKCKNTSKMRYFYIIPAH